MATIKYEIPIYLNPHTDVGIIDTSIHFAKEGVLYPINEIINIDTTPSPCKLIVRNNLSEVESINNADVWAFPVKLRTVTGKELEYQNINGMKINIYNDIRRVIILNISKSGYISNILYIDPPVGYYDLEEPNDLYSFIGSEQYIDNCVDSIKVSTEGQILIPSLSYDNKIYSIYQIREKMIMFSNKGVFALIPIDEFGFFEMHLLQNYDVKSAIRTYATESIVWFIYNNELYVIQPNMEITRIGGKNLISTLNNNTDTLSILATSDTCVINNYTTRKCIFYKIGTGFSGICGIYTPILDIDKFGISEYSPGISKILEIKNELNDSRLKLLKAVVIKGLQPPLEIMLQVKDELNPNYSIYRNIYFNNEGVANIMQIFSSLNIIILSKYSFIERKRNDRVKSIEIYYEYIERKLTYRFEQPYRIPIER